MPPSVPETHLPFVFRDCLQRGELAAAEAAGSPGLPRAGTASPAAADQWGLGVESASFAGETQPVLFYSVRPVQGPEPEPPRGPALEADAVPVATDPQEQLAGQVHMVEAGRAHGFACIKGTPGADLEVVAYVDGIEVGRTQATLPTQTPTVARLCQLEEEPPAGFAAAAAQQQQPRLGADGAAVGVGFVVPLPPLPAGVHVVSLRCQTGAI